MTYLNDDPKTISSWALYDWANSAYNLVISTAVFPPFFASMAPNSFSLFGSDWDRDSIYSFSISVSYLIIALMLPVLSGVADLSGKRKNFLRFFTVMGSIACMALFWFTGPSMAVFALIASMLGIIGFGSSQVFYNAYLPVIASKPNHDKVSAKGYVYGYVGSVILLIAILAMIQFKDAIGISDSSLPPRIGFFLVGIWWIVFGFISFRRLPKDQPTPFSENILTAGLKEVWKVGKKIWMDKNKVKFLGSYSFYIAGVNIVILLASLFASEELKFESSELILLILLLQFLAGIGAYTFAFISKKKGNKVALMIQLIIWVFICISSYFVQGKIEFYIIAVFVGMVFGGIQSLSRSTFSKMINDESIPLTSYFSFYQVLTTLSVVMGTLAFGIVREITGNLRDPVLATSAFFILGLIIMLGAQLNEVGE